MSLMLNEVPSTLIDVPSSSSNLRFEVQGSLWSAYVRCLLEVHCNPPDYSGPGHRINYSSILCVPRLSSPYEKNGK